MSGAYDVQYPPDRLGDETGENGRVWRVYRDRATANDEVIIGSWNGTLDVLLIFAGLFSAVATAFLVEAQKQLGPDQTKYLTAAFIAVHLNQSIQDSKFNPNAYVAPVSIRWATGLWLASLVIALMVALLAILAKQWLAEYGSRKRGAAASDRDWAMRHVKLYQGIRTWKVHAFIGALPIALHASLFLFLGGLVNYFWSINIAMAVFTLATTGAGFIIYVVAIVAPIRWPECPTGTPSLTRFLGFMLDLFTKLCSNDSSADDATKEPLYLRGQAQALSWMICHLPAFDDLRVTITAIGRLHAANPVPHNGSEFADLCNRHVAHILAQRTADLLSTESSETGHILEQCIRARSLIQGRWSAANSMAIPPPVPEGYRRSPNFSPERNIIAETLLQMDIYPASFDGWLSSTDKLRPYAVSSLPLLVGLQAAIGPRTGALVTKLQLPIRLLAYELEQLVHMKVAAQGLAPLLDLLQAEMRFAPRRAGTTDSTSPDLTLRCVHVAGQLLIRLGSTEHQSQSPRFQTLQNVLKSALWSVLNVLTELSPSEIVEDDVVQFVHFADELFADRSPWPLDIIGGMCHLLSVTHGKAKLSFTLAAGRSRRILLAQLMIVHKGDNSLWVSKCIKALLEPDFTVEINCGTTAERYERNDSARSMCSLLDGHSAEPSAMRLVATILPPTTPAYQIFHSHMCILTASMKRLGHNVESLVKELIGKRPDASFGVVDLFRQMPGAAGVYQACHLKQICPEKLWSDILDNIGSLSDLDPDSKSDLLSMVSAVKPCFLCHTQSTVPQDPSDKLHSERKHPPRTMSTAVFVDAWHQSNVAFALKPPHNAMGPETSSGLGLEDRLHTMVHALPNSQESPAIRYVTFQEGIYESPNRVQTVVGS